MQLGSLISDPQRLAALAASGLVDSPAEEAFDALTRLVQHALKAPIAILALVDAEREFFKSVQGLPAAWKGARGLPLAQSFCRHVVAAGASVVIPDTKTHALTRDKEAASEPNVRAYIGVPVRAPGGEVLGALCAKDVVPRPWSDSDERALADLSRAVEAHLAAQFYRRQAEFAQAARLREREILTLAERSAGIGVWDIDLASDTARATPQFFRLMGLEPTSEPVPMDTFRALRHPEDRSKVRQGFRRALDSGTDSYEMEYRIIRPDGATRWIFGRGRVIRAPDGTPVRYSGVDMDVTARREAEAALAESQERLRLAQDAAGIGIWDRDIVSGGMTWSASQWRLYGLAPRPGGPTHDEWKQSIDPDDRDRASAALSDAILGKSAYDTEYRVTLPSGEVRWLAGRGSVITDETGRPVRIVGVDVDITERHAAAESLEKINRELERRVAERSLELESEAARRIDAESRLHQAQKMEAVGQLTGGLAHDFNNLLTVIIGNLDMIKRRLNQHAHERIAELGVRLTTPIDMAIAGAMNAAQLTHRLLAFSRRQALEPKIIDVNQLICGMSDMIARTLGETIQVETSLAMGLWPTFADANQLESSLLNLVVNARDAMPQGGKLLIETANAKAGETSARGTEAGDSVVLSVTDTGVGIASDNLDRVFEPFFTTKETGKGSGLGLSMVHGFVAQSGGHLSISSAVGIGTTVKLYLPRGAESASAQAGGHYSQTEPSKALPRGHAGETILIVEDNENVRKYAVAVLEELGYTVLMAVDAASAMRLLETIPVHGVDLIFTDIVLPGSMSGLMLADEASRVKPGSSVLFTTGYSQDAALAQDPFSAGRQLLLKPYDAEGLARKVREVLDSRRRSAHVIPFRGAGPA